MASLFFQAGRRQKVTLLATVFLSAISCSSSTVAEQETLLRIETSQELYAAGDSVTVTVTNVSDQGVAFFACPVYVERSGEVGWAEYAVLAGYGDDDCDLMSTALPPGSSTSFRAKLVAIPSGIYRLRIDGLARRRDLQLHNRISNSFTIQ